MLGPVLLTLINLLVLEETMTLIFEVTRVILYC